MLEFRYLPAFFAVAEHRSFTEAGKQLHIATSAVSRQVQLLEAASGVQLFFRSAREARLTPEGQRLFEEMRHFQVEANKILDQGAVETLRLGTLQGVLQHWLVDLVGSELFFRSLNLEIRVAGPAELVSGIDSGELDAALFSHVHLTRVPASMRVYRLFREEIVLISKTRIRLDAIDTHPWILLSRGTWLVRYRKRQPERFIVVNHMGAVVELVRRGMGIAMVPAYAVRDRQGLQVQEVKQFSRQYICLVARHYDREPRLLGELVTLVSRHAPDWKQLQ